MKFRPVGKESSSTNAAGETATTNPKQVVVAVASKKKKQKKSHATTAAAAAPPVATTSNEASAAVAVTITAVANNNHSNKHQNKENDANKKQKKMETKSTTAKAPPPSLPTKSTSGVVAADHPLPKATTKAAAVKASEAAILSPLLHQPIATKPFKTTHETTVQQLNQQQQPVAYPHVVAATSTKTSLKHRPHHRQGKRGSTMLPADWWNIEHPSQKVPLLSRGVVEYYYQRVVPTPPDEEGQQPGTSTPSSQPSDSSLASPSSSSSHQAQLDQLGVGVLSLEEVLIPAVAHEETEALRNFQSKVQREYKNPVTADVVDSMDMDKAGNDDQGTPKPNPPTMPDVGAMVQECRRAVFNSTAFAIRGAQEARLAREAQWALEQAAQAKARQEQQEKEKVEYIRRRQNQKHRQQMERKKRLPHNQELWREVAYLMTGLGKLQKEQRVWKEMEQTLLRQEEELQRQEEKKQANHDGAVVTMETNKILSNPQALVENELALDQRLEQLLESTTTSAKAIQTAMQVVSDVLRESEQVEQELHRNYLLQHRFQGFKGIHNPPELIKLLSQSQDA